MINDVKERKELFIKLILFSLIEVSIIYDLFKNYRFLNWLGLLLILIYICTLLLKLWPFHTKKTIVSTVFLCIIILYFSFGSIALRVVDAQPFGLETQNNIFQSTVKLKNELYTQTSIEQIIPIKWKITYTTATTPAGQFDLNNPKVLHLNPRDEAELILGWSREQPPFPGSKTIIIYRAIGLKFFNVVDY